MPVGPRPASPARRAGSGEPGAGSLPRHRRRQRAPRPPRRHRPGGTPPPPLPRPLPLWRSSQWPSRLPTVPTPRAVGSGPTAGPAFLRRGSRPGTESGHRQTGRDARGPRPAGRTGTCDSDTQRAGRNRYHTGRCAHPSHAAHPVACQPCHALALSRAHGGRRGCRAAGRPCGPGRGPAGRGRGVAARHVAVSESRRHRRRQCRARSPTEAAAKRDRQGDRSMATG